MEPSENVAPGCPGTDRSLQLETDARGVHVGREVSASVRRGEPDGHAQIARVQVGGHHVGVSRPVGPGEIAAHVHRRVVVGELDPPGLGTQLQPLWKTSSIPAGFAVTTGELSL